MKHDSPSAVIYLTSAPILKYDETFGPPAILNLHWVIQIETVSPEGTFCDTVQVPSCGGDMELI